MAPNHHVSAEAAEHRDDVSEDIDPLDEALAQLDADHQLVDYAPSKSQLLRSFDVICLFMNRTLGSGIYAQPPAVLEGTRSLGAALILWVLGGVVALCLLLVWLEFGLSIPVQRDLLTGSIRNVPRSGGEKNFLEYAFIRPKFLATCTYGIMFLLLGNLAGNAIYIGQYTMLAAGREIKAPRWTGDLGPPDGAVVGIAIAALTLSVLMHVFSRRGGIILNNIFAVVKVCFILTIIVLGFINLGYARAGNESPGGWHSPPNITMIQNNFKPSQTFKAREPARLQGDGPSVISSFLYVIYSYSGFYQVFYVLGEVATPRRTVPKASFFALGLTVLLFVLVNVSYFLVVPVDDYITDNRVPPSIDLAERFFTTILGDKIGRKVMCSLLVISVFGNLLTLSFVAGRVKQEIAKEGILPFSRFFAKGNQTPLSWLKARMTSTTSLGKVETERAPITGLFLHWITTMICIISTSWLRPSLSINIWVTLFGFSIRLIIPSIVSGSLIYLKLRKSCGWKEISAYNCGLIPAVVVLSVMMTVFWNGFAKSAVRFTVVTPYWILPFIALSSVLWGMFWWVGLKGLEWVRKEEMVATRTAVLDQRDNGEWVQVAEVVDIEWRARRAPDVESFETPKRDR